MDIGNGILIILLDNTINTKVIIKIIEVVYFFLLSILSLVILLVLYMTLTRDTAKRITCIKLAF